MRRNVLIIVIQAALNDSIQRQTRVFNPCHQDQERLQQDGTTAVLRAVMLAVGLKRIVRLPCGWSNASIRPHIAPYHVPLIFRMQHKLAHGVVRRFYSFGHRLAIIMVALVLFGVSLDERLFLFVSPMPACHLHHANQFVRVVAFKRRCYAIDSCDNRLKRCRIDLPVYVCRGKQRQPGIIVLPCYGVCRRCASQACVVSAFRSGRCV